jgi:hypothetical protein
MCRFVNSLGLATDYQRRQSVHSFCRQIMALPFLPPDDIPQAFTYLEQKATKSKLNDLTSYVRNTWIESEIWPPSSWSCFGRSIRTNNDVEGWHARLNRRNACGNLGLYQLSFRLYAEAQLVSLTMKVMSERKVVRCQRASSVRTNARLQKLWDSYAAGSISWKKLMVACAHIH